MSNKTPTKPEDETESAHRRKSPFGLVLGVILLAIGVFVVASGISGLTDNKQRLFAPNGFITVEIVDTPESRAQGLSGRESIGDDEGMLFVFDDELDTNCFWMKDMKFSIDMIWLNEAKEVVHVEGSVEPSTYPNSFCPDSPAKYGLEIQGHRSPDLGIVEGEKLRF